VTRHRDGTARRRVVGLLLAVAALLATSGCEFADLQFRADTRLHFTAPKARSLVTTPLTISWQMKDFAATGLDGSHSKSTGAFAVFVDRAPMPVGKDLRWLARKDSGCKRDPRCPDAAYLADRGIFVTSQPSIRLDVLPAASDGVGDEQHYVNVVLVDGTGHRIGESSWYRPFKTKRRANQ
jgi:hypothetical protein